MIRPVVLASCTCAAMVAWPATVIAQQRVFIEGLAEFTAAVAGTYGDEGTRIGPALDKMAAGLAEWDRAIQGFEGRVASESSAASSRVTVDTRVALARMYVERGRLTDAARELEAASHLVPERADLHVLRGLVLEASAHPAEAGEAFRAAWTADANDPINAYYAFRHASTIGKTNDAQRARDSLAMAYRTLLQDPQRATASPFAGLQRLPDGATDTPVLSPASYTRGYADLVQGEYEKAIVEFRTAAAIDPLVVDPAIGSPSMRNAVAALRQGRLGDARTLVDTSVTIRGSSEAHRVLGLIEWTDSRDDKSIDELERAIDANPRNERARLALARVLSSARRDSDAERVLRETLEVIPDSSLAHWWLGSSHERQNRFADARREFELATAGLVAGEGPVYASIGRLAAGAADFLGASEAFARAVAVRPNDATLRKYLAGTLLQQDRTDEGFAELVVAAVIDPSDASAHASIGRIYLNAGQYDEAVTALRRAVAVSPDHTEARYALATALMRMGNTQEASQEFARVAQAQGQLLADRRRTMGLDVLKEEAGLRAAEGNYERAAVLWQQVIDREPGRLSNHLALAAAMADAGRTDAAIERYETAATLGAEPDVYRQLAALYAKVGRVEDAARATALYNRALLRSSPAGVVR